MKVEHLFYLFSVNIPWLLSIELPAQNWYNRCI